MFSKLINTERQGIKSFLDPYDCLGGGGGYDGILDLHNDCSLRYFFFHSLLAGLKQDLNGNRIPG